MSNEFERPGGWPAIAVITPAYNAEKTLGAQLEALSRQVMDEPWEIIVADNGSTDTTANIAQAWTNRLPLRVIDASSRRGPSAARNAGAGAARAPLLAFCDADDVVGGDWLSKVLAALRVDEFVAVTARRRLAHSSLRSPALAGVVVHASGVLPGIVACGASQMAVRADVFREVGGFDESLRSGEDIDLSCRIQLAGHRLVPHSEAVIDYSPRSGIIPRFRQHYRWAFDAAAVKHKWARVAPVLQGAVQEGRLTRATEVVVTYPQEAPAKRTQRLIAAVRDPAEAIDLLGRLWAKASIPAVESFAEWLGGRRGTADPSQPQLDAALAHRYLALHGTA